MNTLKRLEKVVLLGWQSLISDILDEYSIGELKIASGKIYEVSDTLPEYVEKKLKNIKDAVSTYLNLLLKENDREIQEHLEYLLKEMDEIISYIDENLKLIKNDGYDDNVVIKQKVIKALLLVRKNIISERKLIQEI